MKPAAWSHSALESYENCPKQHFETKVRKPSPYPFVDTVETKWGRDVHKHFEHFLLHGTLLPADLDMHREFLQAFKDQPGELAGEERIALDINLKQCAYFGDPNIWYRGQVDARKRRRDVGHTHLLDHKGLPLDTLISTPQGFTTMGKVQVGDLVHASDGRAYPVTVKSDIHHRPCFVVMFDDKTSVICDNVHLWSLVDGSTVPVTELVVGKSCIPLAETVEFVTGAEMPIDPYVLGLWLADGKHTSGEISKPDPEVWAEIERRGYGLGADTGRASCSTRTVRGLRTQLRLAGLLGNKHIPECFMRADKGTRVALVQGLMDGDGSVNGLRKQVVFQTTDRKLSCQVKELMESLGTRVSQAKYRYRGFGVEGWCYPLTWRPWRFVPFLLPRKARLVEDWWGSGQSGYRRVTGVVPAPARETQCIGVASPDNTYLCGPERVVTHNTGKVKNDYTQLKGFAMWEFLTQPEIHTVKAEYYWTQIKGTNGETYYREQLPEILKFFAAKLNRFADAYIQDVWPARQSGLCGWCPVTSCEFWRERRRSR